MVGYIVAYVLVGLAAVFCSRLLFGRWKDMDYIWFDVLVGVLWPLVLFLCLMGLFLYAACSYTPVEQDAPGKAE